MKRIILLLSFLLLLSGCTAVSASDLSNRLIIEAIGVDLDEAGYKVTVLALNTLQTGSANSTETPDGISKVFSATGDSLAKAFTNIDLISGQVPLYSQARALILGKDLAKNEPMKALNFFIREYTTRDDIPLAVADSTASQIISANLGKNLLTSKVIQNILESGELNGQTVAVPLYRFVNSMINETDTAYLPIIKAEKNDRDEEELSTVGMALFPQENYTVTLDDKTTAGLLWAADLVDNTLLQVTHNKNNVSLAVKRTKTEIKLKDEKKPAFIIRISFACDMIEFNDNNTAQSDLETVNKIKTLAEEQVQKSVEEYLKTAMRENACDCLSFGRRVKNKNQSAYNSITLQYADFLKSVDVEVQTEAEILRIGREILKGN